MNTQLMLTFVYYIVPFANHWIEHKHIEECRDNDMDELKENILGRPHSKWRCRRVDMRSYGRRRRKKQDDDGRWESSDMEKRSGWVGNCNRRASSALHGVWKRKTLGDTRPRIAIDIRRAHAWIEWDLIYWVSWETESPLGIYYNKCWHIYWH